MTQDIRFRVGIDGVQQVQQGASQVEASLDRIGKASTAAEERASGTFASIASAGRAIAGLAIAQQLVQAAGAAVRAADSVTVLNNKLALATGSAAAATTAYEALYGIAQRSRTSFTELGSTYASIARATDGLGVSQQRLLKITEAIGNAMAISGGSAEGMQAALTQLGQGLASGTLRGDELNSVLEQTPRLARAIADGMGVTVGKLRELGQEGKLTAEAILQALESQSGALAKEVESSVVTVGQAMTQLSNSATRAIGELDRASGATSSIAGGLQSLSGIVDDVSDRFSRARESGLGFFSSLAAAQAMGLAEALGHVDERASNVGRRLAEAEKELAKLQLRFAERGGFYLAQEVQKAEELRDRLREAKKAQDELKLERGTSQSQQFGQASSAIDALAKKGLEEQAAATKLLTDIRSKALGVDAAYVKQVYELNAARQKGFITEKQYIETVQQLTAATFKQTAATRQDAKAMDDAVKAYEDLTRAGRDWARSIGLTNAALEKELELRRPLTEAERQLVELDQKLASGLLVMTPAIEAAARAEVKRGDALRESVRWQRDAAEENARALDRLQDQTAAIEGRAEAARRDNDQTLLSAAALREVQQAELLAAAAAKERRAVLFDNINPEIANEYRRQAAALRESAAQAGRAAAIEAAKESAEQWSRAADTITGLLTNAIQMGGKAGWDYVRDYIKANAIQALVQYAVNGVGQWLGLAKAMGGAAAIGGSGGAGGLGMTGRAYDLGSAALGAYNVAGGYLGYGGATAGAAYGTVGYANAVGAVGGDSLGALIAANNSWGGVAAGSSLGAAEAGAGVAAGSGAAAGGGASWAASLGPYAAVALVLLAMFGDFSKFSLGTVAEGSFGSDNKLKPDQFGDILWGNNTEKTRGGQLQSAVDQLGLSIGNTANFFGGELGGLGLSLGTDLDRHGTMSMIIRLMRDGQIIAGTQTGSGAFGAGENTPIWDQDALNIIGRSILPSEAAKKLTEDELGKWWGEQLPVVIVQALQESDLPDRFDAYFDSVQAGLLTTEKANELLSTATAVQTFSDSVAPLGGAFSQFADLSVEAVRAIAVASGGFDALGQSVSTYYSEFYSAEEQTRGAWDAITKTLNDVGITAIPKTKAEFRSLVDSLDDLGTKADQDAFNALMRVAGAFDALTESSEAAALQLQAEADARLKSAVQLIDQNAGKFLGEASLRQYRYGRISQDLQDAGLSVSAQQLADATKEEIRAFVQSFVDFSDGISQVELAALGAAGALADLKDSTEQAAVANSSRTAEGLLMSYDMLLSGQQQARDAVRLREMFQAVTPDDLWNAASPGMRELYTKTGQVPEVYLTALTNTIVAQRLSAERGLDATRLASDALNRNNSGLENLTAPDPVTERAMGLLGEQVQATEDLTASIDRLEDSLGDYIDSLLTGSLTALSPEQQLAEARAQFEATLGQADAGNLDAVAMLDDVASTYLELQKELTGAATYAPVFDDVLAELRRVKEELAAIKGNTRAGAEASAASGAVVAEAVEASARLAAQQAGYEAAARGRYVAAL